VSILLASSSVINQYFFSLEDLWFSMRQW